MAIETAEKLTVGTKLDMVYKGYVASGVVMWNGTVFINPVTRTLNQTYMECRRVFKRADGRWGVMVCEQSAMSSAQLAALNRAAGN